MLIKSVNVSRLFHETTYNQVMTEKQQHLTGKKKKKKTLKMRTKKLS